MKKTTHPLQSKPTTATTASTAPLGADCAAVLGGASMCDACVRIASAAQEELGVSIIGRGFDVAMAVLARTSDTPP